MNGLVAKIDEQGPFAWIGLMVVSFIIFWPAGLAVLAFLIWSGRMGCRSGRWGGRGFARWQDAWQDKKQRWKAQPSSSGNHAFDEYREETIRRLEDEEREFHEFLGRLRQAKDRQEFDEFMADRRRRREAGEETPPHGQGGHGQGGHGQGGYGQAYGQQGPAPSGNPA